MIEYRTNPSNEEYIIIDVKTTIYTLFLGSKNKNGRYKNKVSSELLEKLNQMQADLFDYEREHKTGYIKEISIPKTSELATFLIENTDMKEIINDDKRVSYDKVVNAFNIAMFEDSPYAKEILPLFQNQISGNIDELVKKYNNNTLTYILKNSSFETYLEHLNKTYEEKDYIVYENGKFSTKKLISSKKERYIIGIEDITANAFIELKKRNTNVNPIPIWILEEYGNQVVKYLDKEGKDAYLWLSRIQTNEFLYHYRKYFQLDSAEKIDDAIELKENIERVELIETFRSYLPLSLCLAYQDEKVVEEGLLKYLNESQKGEELSSKKVFTKEFKQQ